MYKKCNKYIIFLCFISVLLSQENMPRLYFDNSENTSNTYNLGDEIMKTAAMSLLVPGLGQYKQGRKGVAAGFFALELSLIYLNQVYSNKADNNISEYQTYADQHWSFEDWILNYNDPLWSASDSEFYDMFSDPEGNWYEIWMHSHHISFYIEGHPDYHGLYNTSQDDTFGYNLYEDFTSYGEGFMDEYNVSIIKDHHFYEGIRKYNMFFAGWDDSEQIQADSNGGYKIAVSPNKNEYNRIWNESIDFYDYAETAITGLYLNHLISALEVYIKNKFDNRFDLNSAYDYNKYSESISYSVILSVDLK